MTCLGIGEEGKASGIPCRAHEHPWQALLLPLVSCSLDCLSPALGVSLKYSLSCSFLLSKSLSGGEFTLFMLSLVSKVKSGPGRSQGQSLGLPVNPESCPVFGE